MASNKPITIHRGLELSDASPISDTYHRLTNSLSKHQSEEAEGDFNGQNRISAPSQKKFKSSSTKEKETTKQLTSKRVLFGIKAAIGLVLLIVVLACTVLSKLTLVTLTDQLRITERESSEDHATTRVTLYWYIQLILLIPSFITFVRCFVVGVFGKTIKSFPWPTGKAILYGIFGSILEVLAMTVLMYLVLPQLSPGVGMLLLCGVFFFQIIIDAFKTPHWYWCQNNRCSCAAGERNGYNPLRTARQKVSLRERFVRFVQIILENKVMKLIALLLQIFGIAGFIAAWIIGMNSSDLDKVRPMIGAPLAILILSLVWSSWFQKKINDPYKRNLQRDVTARYKSANGEHVMSHVSSEYHYN